MAKKIDFARDVLPLKDRLFRLALRITLSREDAEDLVQDTLLKVWARREELMEVRSLEAFALTVCRNLSLDLIKKKSNTALNMEEDETKTSRQYVVDTAPTPLDTALVSDKMRVVKAIIDTLPEKQRVALQLRDFESKSYRDISEIMQISEEQVKVSIFRARQAVKKSFYKVDNYGL